VLKLEPVGSSRKTVQLAAFYNELLRRVETIPSVRLTSLIAYSPMSRREWLVMGDGPESKSPLSAPGYAPQPDEDMRIDWMQVYPNSFATIGIPLLSGRDFSLQDNRQSQWVAVINESMARHFFGNENPIGRRFSIRASEIEIIGVAKDVKYRSLREQGRPMFYLSFFQPGTNKGQMTLIVRTAGDPMQIASVVQREARALDPAMPMFEVETAATQIAASTTRERLVAMLSSCFGLLALLLTCIGLYGILSYTVANRTNEIGIRMALGAERRDVLWLVLRDALRLALIGIAVGIPVALAATRLVSSQLFGISAADPLTLSLSILILLAVAALAGYLPARRATRVDPLVALKYE